MSKDRLKIIAGPCVIENEKHTLFLAKEIKNILKDLEIELFFKASFDKANRTSHNAFRGPGLEKGLKILSIVKKETGLPIVSDIHLPSQAEPAGQILDVIQIPAFLCRQTDLIENASKTGRIVNIKKGQFISPVDAEYLIKKARAFHAKEVWLTERGTTFGAGGLVVDYSAFPLLKSFGAPLIMDATHSAQTPGMGKGSTSGNRSAVRPLALAALAAGAHGLFLEVHDKPERSPSDSGNILPLTQLYDLIRSALDIYTILG